MNKNGMRNNSFKSASSKKGFDLQSAILYCKSKGIKIEDLTDEELKQFEIK